MSEQFGTVMKYAARTGNKAARRMAADIRSQSPITTAFVELRAGRRVRDRAIFALPSPTVFWRNSWSDGAKQWPLVVC